MRISNYIPLKKTFIFLLLIITTRQLLILCFHEPSMLKYRLFDFSNGSFNTVILGQSFSEYNLSPRHLSADDSEKVFNFGQPGIQLSSIYYFLQELNKNNNIKRTYLELYYPYWSTPYEGLPPYIIFKNLTGSRKLKYFFNEYCRKDYNKFLYPSLMRHFNTIKIRHNISQKFISLSPQNIEDIINDNNPDKNCFYVGNGFFYNNKYTNIPYSKNLFKSSLITKDSLKSFKLICSYCKAHDIQLICFISALPPKRLIFENHDETHIFFKELCEQNKVKFIDMNFIHFNLLPRNKLDYQDSDGHMMGALAEKHAALLKEISNSSSPEKYFTSNYSNIIKDIMQYDKVNKP